uniref:(northern house mosquito) hypothetical protein n=1 Tax=Culex pipiens TaxID=7175 RepID=A0A8D8CGS8_CULPI
MASMSPPIATCHSRNLNSTDIRGESKSGPFIEFRETPSTFAAASQIRRTFPGLFGLMTTPSGRYQVRRGSNLLNSSAVALWANPFCWKSAICFRTLSYSV